MKEGGRERGGEELSTKLTVPDIFVVFDFPEKKFISSRKKQ